MASALLFALNICTIVITGRVLCGDIRKTEIKVVNDENRYTTLYADQTYTPFSSTYNAKGNIFFKLGERITGDRVILTDLESTSYTWPTNAEVSIWYPSNGYKGYTITCIEYVAQFTTKDAAAYLVGGGGIFDTYAETLLVANETMSFGFQYVLYGF